MSVRMHHTGELAVGPVLHAGAGDARAWRFTIQLLVRVTAREGALPPPVAIDSPDDGVTITPLPGPIDLRPEGAPYASWSWSAVASRDVRERAISYRLALDPAWTLTGLVARAGALAAGRDGPRLVLGPVRVPALGALPRVAAHSCGWFSHGDPVTAEDDVFARWRVLLARHQADALDGEPGGFHLQLGLGDQLYVDSLLETDWIARLWDRPFDAIPAEAPGALLDAYLRQYAERWGAPDMARVLARLPGLFTWDDHEIMDGWGSFPVELQESPGRRLFFEAARRAFEVVQLAGRAERRHPAPLGFALPRGLPPPARREAAGGPAAPPHLLQAASFVEPGRELHVVLLDLRSERTPGRVLADEWQWRDLDEWLDAFTARARLLPAPRHLLVVSSIPPVFMAAVGGMSTALGVLPEGHELQDDLRDQWEHPAHTAERERLLRRLFRVEAECGARVTILSGDVHVGAHASLRQGEGPPALEIDQLVTSGMVHPSPGWLVERLSRGAAALRRPVRLGPGLTGEQLLVDGQLFLTRQNYLELRVDESPPDVAPHLQGRLVARWVTDAGPLGEPARTIPASPVRA